LQRQSSAEQGEDGEEGLRALFGALCCAGACLPEKMGTMHQSTQDTCCLLVRCRQRARLNLLHVQCQQSRKDGAAQHPPCSAFLCTAVLVCENICSTVIRASRGCGYMFSPHFLKKRLFH